MFHYQTIFNVFNPPMTTQQKPDIYIQDYFLTNKPNNFSG